MGYPKISSGELNRGDYFKFTHSGQEHYCVDVRSNRVYEIDTKGNKSSIPLNMPVILVKKSTNPILSTLGTAVITGVGLGTGFRLLNTAVDKIRAKMSEGKMANNPMSFGYKPYWKPKVGDRVKILMGVDSGRIATISTHHTTGDPYVDNHLSRKKDWYPIVYDNNEKDYMLKRNMHPIKYNPIGNHKFYGGIPYLRVYESLTKKFADDFAKSTRAGGYPCRVEKIGNIYVVWARELPGIHRNPTITKGSPYSHYEETRESRPGGGDTCDWCGQKRKTLYKYNNRKGWFCNKECYSSYHF